MLWEIVIANFSIAIMKKMGHGKKIYSDDADCYYCPKRPEKHDKKCKCIRKMKDGN